MTFARSPTRDRYGFLAGWHSSVRGKLDVDRMLLAITVPVSDDGTNILLIRK